MRQDEAIASSWFWSKIDFSEEKCYGKCLEEHFWASRFQNFLGGGGALPPAPLSGLRLQRSKLASSCSEVWLRPCFVVASTFASNPSWFNWAVFLGQKLATLGKDVAPNRCFTIRYSCISFARSLLGHHTNLFFRSKKCQNLLGPPGIGETCFYVTNYWWCLSKLCCTIMNQPHLCRALRDALRGS